MTKDLLPMEQLPNLSPRQKQALWYRAQGLTAQTIGRHLDPPISAPGVQDLLHKAMQKLSAPDTTAAVFRALCLGILGPYLDCGSRAAYYRHLRRREPTCLACRIHNHGQVLGGVPDRFPPVPGAGHNRGWENLRPRARAPIAPSHIDILLCVRDGCHSVETIARHLGKSRGFVRPRLDDLFERLDIDTDLLGTGGALKQAEREATTRKLLPVSGGYAGRSDRLTESQVKLILLARDDTLSLTEISAVLGVAPRTAGSRLNRLYVRFGLSQERTSHQRDRSRRQELYRLAREAGLLTCG